MESIAFQHLEIKVGDKFDRWTTIEFTGGGRGKGPSWLCECECGTRRVIRARSLFGKRRSRSCGCYNRDSKTKHGGFGTDIYTIWANIKGRCCNKNDAAYHKYGGRGIKMCQRWQDSFEAFRDDIGPRPSSQHTVDRRDNDGHYEPNNCRWATKQEQGRNTRHNLLITHGGETRCLKEWAEVCGISYDVLHWRVSRKKMLFSEAISLPVKTRKRL